MTELFGITGAVIAVASLLLGSCQTIRDIIASYKRAPKEYQDLATDLHALQNSLNSLRNFLLSIQGSSLSPGQQDSLRDLELLLKTCKVTFEDLKTKLTNITLHSPQDHAAQWDRFLLHFSKSDIVFLRDKLNSVNDTISVALGVLNLKTSTENQVAFVTFQDSTAVAMGEFLGRVEALGLAKNSVSISGVNIAPKDAEVVQRTLHEHGELSKECLAFCATALEAANAAVPRARVKHTKVVAHARRVIGNYGSSTSHASPVVVEIDEMGIEP